MGVIKRRDSSIETLWQPHSGFLRQGNRTNFIHLSRKEIDVKDGPAGALW
jgi:hypothetical protein